MRGFCEKGVLRDHGLEGERIFEKDADGVEREWVWMKGRGIEDAAVLRRVS